MEIEIKINKNRVVNEQILSIKQGINIIYGLNNSGKTYILKDIAKYFYNENLLKAVKNENIMHYSYIPTNRVVLRNIYYRKTEDVNTEAYLRYINTKSIEYDLHLTRIHNELSEKSFVVKYIKQKIKCYFEIDIENFFDEFANQSDGVKNIINIYLELIWTALNDSSLSYEGDIDISQLLTNISCIFLIDEIEIFLHVRIQEKLLQSLIEDFPNSTFIITTHSPLLLSRVANADTYEIKSGDIHKNYKDLFYSDLDKIYEVYFGVNEIPKDLENDMKYLYNVIDGDAEANLEQIEGISKRINEKFPNLFEKYNKIILFARRKAEK